MLEERGVALEVIRALAASTSAPPRSTSTSPINAKRTASPRSNMSDIRWWHDIACWAWALPDHK
jgi:hypothetical protein